MSFYQSISRYYDIIFPASEGAVRFINKRAASGSRILDVACGTGSHVLALADKGHQVQGVDLDADMIARAQEKAGDSSARFQVGDMRKLEALFSPGSLDLIYCIGNSIVHLGDEAGISGTLQSFFALLVPGGRLVIQIVNYDRILHDRVTELPLIRSEESGLTFERIYSYGAGDRRVNFETRLTVREGDADKVISNTIPLFILEQKLLRQLAEQAGFEELALYGSFEEEPCTVESFPAILSASKSSRSDGGL